MKKLLTIICVFFATGIAMAQETDSKERHFAIGVSGGTGFGGDLSYKLNDYFSVSARYNMLSYREEGIKQELDGEDFLIDAEVDFKNIDLVFSIYPFKSSFKIVAGASYFLNSDLSIQTSFAESVFIGDVEFTPESGAGNLIINSDFGQVAPYLAIGFGRAVPNKRLGFGIEAGAYYTGSPTVTLDATGVIENTVDQEPLVQDAFSEFKFIPYLALRLAYAF
ncbi:hypothetical protein [Wenyingzhuangia sp. IMCC45574]